VQIVRPRSGRRLSHPVSAAALGGHMRRWNRPPVVVNCAMGSAEFSWRRRRKCFHNWFPVDLAAPDTVRGHWLCSASTRRCEPVRCSIHPASRRRRRQPLIVFTTPVFRHAQLVLFWRTWKAMFHALARTYPSMGRREDHQIAICAYRPIAESSSSNLSRCRIAEHLR